MRVDDVGHEGRHQPLTDIGGGPAERREATGIVRPVPAVGREIGRARPLEEMGRVDHEKIEIGGGAGEKACRSSEEGGIFVKEFGAVQRLQHRRITGKERDDLHALLRKGRRQGADHIGEAACLDDGKDL